MDLVFINDARKRLTQQNVDGDVLLIVFSQTAFPVLESG
jgi:hypothetical protein